jgi:hypothetical protein
MDVRDVPVLLIGFNRPEFMKVQIDRLRLIAPRRVYFASDAPREGRPAEADLVEKTRSAVDQIDWECDVLRDYPEVNIGPGVRIATALRWIFEKERFAVIIEDDVNIHHSFFEFAYQMLVTFEDRADVHTVTGYNPLGRWERAGSDIFFSKVQHLWGWATWKRVIDRCDFHMKSWPAIRDANLLYDILGSRSQAAFWHSRFDATYNGLFDTWDYPYILQSFIDEGKCIVSRVNMVNYLGAGSGSTNTLTLRPYMRVKIDAMEPPFNLPQFSIVDRLADERIFKVRYEAEQSILQQYLTPIKKLVSDPKHGKFLVERLPGPPAKLQL